MTGARKGGDAGFADSLGPRLGPTVTFATLRSFYLRVSPELEPYLVAVSGTPAPAPSDGKLAPTAWQLTLTSAGMVAVVNSVRRGRVRRPRAGSGGRPLACGSDRRRSSRRSCCLHVARTPPPSRPRRLQPRSCRAGRDPRPASTTGHAAYRGLTTGGPWPAVRRHGTRAGSHPRSSSIRRARHRALGKLDPGPDVHVDDDGDDLEHLLRAEVRSERVVEALERRVLIGVGDAGERLGVAERRLLGLGVKLGLPPRGQSVDLDSRDARLTRRPVVQVEAVGAVVELRDPQAQELGETAVDPQVRLVVNASAPIRAMPISASFPRASSRRFATWTSSVISVPFGAHRFPARAFRAPPRRRQRRSPWTATSRPPARDRRPPRSCIRRKEKSAPPRPPSIQLSGPHGSGRTTGALLLPRGKRRLR